MTKARRHGQSRMGNAQRRLLEYAVVCYHVKRDKQAFVTRLQRNLNPSGECLIWAGTLDPKGYGRVSFRFNGRHVLIGVHRVFAILKNCGPIPLGMEAAHGSECTSRACVRHVSLQHYKENAATWPKRKQQAA